MSGKVIGIRLPFGFRGNVSRTPDTVISPYTNVGEEPIQYGEPVIYDAENKGVRKIKSTDTTAETAPVIGIAVRHIGQPYADSPDGYYYAPGDVVDVLVRGSVMVELADVASLAARGKVYVCNGADEAKPAGSIVCAADSEKTLEVPGAIFATGEADGSNIAEVTILTRNM